MLAPALSFALALGAAAAPAYASEVTGARLGPGDSLEAGDTLTSPDGHYVLVMQSDGNLVTYVGSRPVWSTRTHGNPGTVAHMQTDGNFVLYAPRRGAIWSTRTHGHPGARLTLRNDATLRVVSEGDRLWSSGTVDSQVDPDRSLQPGWFVQSPDRAYRLLMQADGNLVLYDGWRHRRPVWSSRTHGYPGSWAKMQTDGNLVVYTPGGTALWDSNTHGHLGAQLRVEDNGRLAIYASGHRLVWSTPPAEDYHVDDRNDIEEVKSVAFQIATDRGWGSQAQHDCIENLWHRESGWRWNADNPYSNAYGIPQANPGWKMEAAGPDWRDNPVTQIKWGYSYIEDRYGSLCNAWAFFQANGWYVQEP